MRIVPYATSRCSCSRPAPDSTRRSQPRGIRSTATTACGAFRRRTRSRRRSAPCRSTTARLRSLAQVGTTDGYVFINIETGKPYTTVVKAALAHNAAAVIFVHKHPSGVAQLSRADELLQVGKSVAARNCSGAKRAPTPANQRSVWAAAGIWLRPPECTSAYVDRTEHAKHPKATECRRRIARRCSRSTIFLPSIGSTSAART